MRFFLITVLFCCWSAFGAQHKSPVHESVIEPAGSKVGSVLKDKQSSQTSHSLESSAVGTVLTKQLVEENRDLPNLEQQKTDSLKEEAKPIPSSFFGLEEESGLEAELKITSGLNMVFEKDKGSRLPFDMGVYGKFKWEFVDFLSVHAEGLVLARRGFQQSFLEREDLKDGVNFLNFYYRAKTPLDLFDSPLIFQFGILNQGFLKAPFLLTNTSFTGLLAKWVYSFNAHSHLSVFLQGTIPYNAEHLFVRPDQLNKVWPFFLSSSVFLDWDDFFGFKVGEKLTFFYIDNLTPEIAGKSRQYGNTVSGTAGSSRFEYNFAGFYNSLALSRIFLTKWIIGVKWDLIWNFLAPKGRNTGDKIQASLKHNYKDFLELGFKVEYFKNESDTSVSYFSSELYGHNNRKGIRLGVHSHLYSSGLTFQANYTYMSPIRSSTWMGRINGFSLMLKSNYTSL